MQINQLPAGVNRTQHYRAFGLSIHSDIYLPELIPAPSQSSADVHIRFGQRIGDIPVPESTSEHFIIANEKVILRAKDFSLAVANGKEMTIHCDDPTSFLEPIRLRILGAGIGVLLQQRESFVLHAATVVGKHGAIVIMGNSGDGKSTLTMQLTQHGYRLSGDDKCAMRLAADGIFALPGSPYIKISKKMAAQTNIDKNKIYYMSALRNKVYVDVYSSFEPSETPIIAGFVLSKSTRISVRKLTQRQTFDSLLEHSYRKKKFFAAGLQKTQFLHCHHMAKSVPVYQYSRPLTGKSLQQPESELLDLLQDIIGSGR